MENSILEKSRRALKLAIRIFVRITLITAAVIYLLITSPKRELDQFLKQVSAVQVGKTRLEQTLGRLEQQHLSRLIVKCGQQPCGFGFNGDNGLLRNLRLAPWTQVMASVQFKDGIASEIYIWTIELRPCGWKGNEWCDATGATIHQSAGPNCNQHYSTYVKQNGLYYWGVVTMDACVSPEEHAKAYALNSGCLAKIAGCETPAEILPQVFGQTKFAPSNR